MRHMNWNHDDLYNCPDDVVAAILLDIKEAADGRN